MLIYGHNTSNLTVGERSSSTPVQWLLREVNEACSMDVCVCVRAFRLGQLCEGDICISI